MDTKTTGKNLNRLRKAKNMTVLELAKITNLTVNSVNSHIENGISSVETLLKYSDALECDLSDFFLEEETDIDIKSKIDIYLAYPYNLINVVYEDFEMINVYAFMETFEELDELEKDVLILRFEKGISYEEISKQNGLSRERNRQIENLALKKLGDPKYGRKCRMISWNDYHKLIKERDALDQENAFLKKELDRYNIEYPPIKSKTDIADMELSVRSYNGLKSAGINYIEDLRSITLEDLFMIRRLDKESMIEIIENARNLGIHILNPKKK